MLFYFSVGRAIGLGHEDGVVALMNSSVGSCDNKPILADDVAGRDQLHDCAFNDGGGCQANCGNGAVECDEVCDSNSVTCSSLGHVDDGSTAACNGSCDGYDTNACTTCSSTETDCNDGIDNDCDGLTDDQDTLDCSAECTVTENPEVSCSDGLDNYCDGAIDDNDADCDSGSGGLPSGASCDSDNQCASGKCKGRPGSRTCR